MARIALHYFPGNSVLHRWDARCKLFGLLIIGATLLPLNITFFIFDSILLMGVVALSRLPVRQFLREFRLWGILLLALFIFQAFFTPGARISALPWLPVSQDGIRLGVFTCWRLSLVLGYAVLFTAITRPREIQDTLIWILRPFRFLPARRIGLMVSLTIHFFAIILDQAEEIHLANSSRLGDRRKNPFRRIKFLALPLLRRSFFRAEDVTFALAARGFRDDLPLHLPRLAFPHLIPIVLLPGMYTIAWWVFV